MNAQITIPDELTARLAEAFHCNGYIRRLNPSRRAAEGKLYKKGDEIRLVADSKRELVDLRRLLRAAGFKYGRPFRHARQYRLPVYGRRQVARFLEIVGDPAVPLDH